MQYAVTFKEVGIWVNQIHNIPVCSQEGWKPFQHVPSSVIDLQYFLEYMYIIANVTSQFIVHFLNVSIEWFSMSYGISLIYYQFIFLQNVYFLKIYIQVYPKNNNEQHIGILHFITRKQADIKQYCSCRILKQV